MFAPCLRIRTVRRLRGDGRMRNGADQLTCIVGARRFEHLFGGPFFHDLPAAHDDDTVANQPNHMQFVADEEVAHTEGGLEIGKQVQHHRLHRYIERSRRLVEDDEIGIERNRTRNAYARLLAARQLMRESIEQVERQADELRKFLAARPQGIAVRAGHHCAEPLMRRLGVDSTSRASFGVYTTLAEVDALAESLIRIREFFR